METQEDIFSRTVKEKRVIKKEKPSLEKIKSEELLLNRLTRKELLWKGRGADSPRKSKKQS